MLEGIPGRTGQRDLPRLPVLRAPNENAAAYRVDVAPLQSECLGPAHARVRKHADERAESLVAGFGNEAIDVVRRDEGDGLDLLARSRDASRRVRSGQVLGNGQTEGDREQAGVAVGRRDGVPLHGTKVSKELLNISLADVA